MIPADKIPTKTVTDGQLVIRLILCVNDRIQLFLFWCILSLGGVLYLEKWSCFDQRNHDHS